MPPSLEIRIVDQNGAPVAGALVSVRTFYEAQYYYGNLLGLTDEQGVVCLTRKQLHQDFERDQLMFPMDYKVGLDECDPEIEVLIRGGAEFRQAKHTLASNSLVSEDVRLLYDRAVNEGLGSARKRLDTRDHTSGVSVQLTSVRDA